MSFLLVNGLEPTIAHGSYDEEAVDIGSTDRAFDGSLRRSRLATKRECKFDITPMTAATAHAWACLFRGLGEAWSFDASLYSANGMGPTSSTGASVSAVQKKFGAKSMLLAGTTGTITFTPNTGAAYTEAFWHWNGASFDHYIYVSGGTIYKNGVAGSGPSGLTVTPSATAMVLASSGATEQYIDDLVILPYTMPAAWAPTWGAAASAFSPLPRLYLTGDAIAEGGTRTVMGSASAKALGAMSGGAYSTALRTLSVVLQGV